jgi:mono/diheme cytochrome c family protein
MVKFLAFIGFVAIVGAIGAAVFFLGGFYSVAATAKDPGIVDWMLIQVRQASIARQAKDAPPTSLDDPAVVQAGARAYAERGCVHCHGAPGLEWSKFSEGLRPDPPDLKKVVPNRESRELFWAVKNGIKMTGMPGFAHIKVPDQEIWAMTAFLKKLPTVSPADYKAWTAGPVVKPVQ